MMESTDQAWQDPYFPTREGAANTTAASMDMAFVDTDDIAERAVFPRRQSVKVAVLVACEPGSKETDPDCQREAKKYLWCSTVSPRLTYTSGVMPVVYEVLEEYIGFPGEAVGSVDPWPELWRQSEPQPTDLRGVFLTHYPRKVLFTKPVTFRTSELPRWKPKNIIGLRTFDEEDD